MLYTLMNNIGNIVVGLVLIVAVYFIIKYLRKNKGGCDGCSKTSCPHNMQNKN